MKLKHITPFIILLTLFSSWKIYNNDILQKITAQLDKYHRQAPQEKVYLHFDKPYYMAGETMWFAGYLFDANGHGIDSVSTVLYVDLIDPSLSKVVQNLKLNCSSGITQGSFALPDTLNEGMYHVRAYTRFMQNYDDAFFFHQDFKIWQGQKQQTSDAEYEQLSQVADIQFFPEGGYMLNDMDSRIAFKAVNMAGHGIDVEGMIMENDTGVVCHFKSEHLGMGMVNFTPKTGKKYTAKMQTPMYQGKNAIIALPAIQPQGYLLNVDNISNKDFVRVIVMNSNPKTAESAKNLTVVGHQRGRFCFGGTVSETKKTSILRMPRYAIPNDGIVHLTLFDPEGKPLCERLIFAQQNKHINLKILADKATYAPREKITLTLEATDTLGKPVEGAFSLAATDGKQVVTEGYNQNLYSYLLMSSDLKGTVEDPAFYFKDQDIKTRRALDILMMTQGWRRFDWADVLNNQYPTLNHNVEQGLAISGRVLRPNNKISKNVNVTLMVKGIDSKETFLAVATADSLGNFVFPNLNIKDSAQILVQAVKEKGGRNLTIRLNTEGVPTIHFEKPKNQSLTFDAKQLAEFLKRTSDKIAFERKLRLDKEQLLNAVEITAKRKKSEDSRRALYGSPSKSIDFTGNNCTNYTSIYSAIQMNIPNVQTAFNSETGITSLSIRGGDVEYLLDGMKTDATFIDGIQPCEIEAIDILRGAEALSVTSGSSAVISILTRRGNASYDYGQDEALGIITRRYNGFVTPAEFYAPKYNIKKPEHEFMDYRSTLHWQPNVKTDANGKAKVEFWASDAMTNVRVVAEGRSNKGQIGVGISQFIVKN